MKKLLFIYNPHSGKGVIKNHLSVILDTLCKADYEITVHSTQYPKHAAELVRDKGRDFDIVVCSGGDGTLSEVLDGLMTIEEENRPDVGYIPAGSTNDYAFSLGLPSQMGKCAQMITEENYRKVDVGCFQDSDYFVYVAAFGAFTEISWNTPQKEKNALGHNAYILEGIKQFSGLKNYHVRIHLKDEEIAGDVVYVMIYNAHSVGGFRNLSQKTVELDDGKLNMMVVYAPENAVEFSMMIADLMTKNPNSKFIAHYEIDDVVIESDTAIEWVLDGEYGGAHKKAHINVFGQAMSIAVPSEKKK